MTPHSNTTALIFGGTQGLGLAIAERLRAEGCTRMVLAARDPDKGAAAAAQLGATFLPCDLADAASVIACVDQAAALMGSVNALCLSAASTDRGSILDTAPEAFDRMFAINTKGPFFAIQRVAQLAKAAQHPASIVTILSMSAHVGQSFLTPYSASKAALSNITKNTANALRHDRIRANGINCGWMDTPGEDAIQRSHHGSTDGWLERAEAAQPFGMLVKPAHVAGLAAYMLGPQSGVMTGSIVDFDQNVSGASPE
ncbi:SDR family oxidoreductase [Pseudotabrizicola sediminis]|uniref:SDR family oxidoreductase n=1 Tax=Pseudotabrizicola sediminis TaxID=2486418 RepID=A0ABY2KPV3_9RHOB|nr:SDR family oxidoreductase [Pseudotabrizicola sediminis]TGD43058.1 SDR family oxidoreductase [Pseudotabrizicola sediminis]